MAKQVKCPWDLRALSRAPKAYPAPDLPPQGTKAMFYDGLISTPELRAADAANTSVKSIYFEGPPFQGKPTLVFAFYGLPKITDGHKVPGIVLVHGGGGTAFESWVRLWNARGFAAIAMDTCGCIPKGEYSKWQRHDAGGPAGWGGFDRILDPVHNQWPYQAVADVILAHSLLRSMPGVDPNRVGITGISWGGYLTCIASSVDNRYKFAVPVYGCGFLGEDSAWVETLESMKDKGADWLGLWDPSVYLRRSTVPTLWVDGTNDFAYPMDSLQKSYRLSKGRRTLCIRVRMPHGHGGLGENPPEIEAFADSVCNHATPLMRITGQGRKGSQVWAKTDGRTKLTKTELNYTTDTGKWQDREWKTIPGAESAASRATATLPEGTRVYYLNLTDDHGLIVSSEHVEIAD